MEKCSVASQAFEDRLEIGLERLPSRVEELRPS